LKNPANTKKHWIVLAAICLMVGSSIGLLVNANGVFYTPMSRDLNLLRGSVALHGTFLSLSTAFGSLTVPAVHERFGWKKTIFFGAFLGAIGTAFMAIATNAFWIYLFGIIRGIGSAYFSMVPMTMIVNQWFHEKNGLAIGFASGTSGIFGGLAAPILATIIESSGWRIAFIVKGLAVFALALPALLIPYAYRPKDEGLRPYGYKPEKDGDRKVRRPITMDTEGAKITFYAVMVVGLLNTMIVFINSHLPGHGEEVGLSLETASFTLSAVMLGNLLSKLSFGIISDKIGTVKTSLGMITLSTISLIMLIFSRDPLILIIGSFLFGAIFSVGGVALPLFSTEFFGPATGVKVYSRVNFIASVGGALSVSLVGYIYDFTGSYIPAFVMALIFNVVNVAAIFIAQRNQPVKNDS